jgi:hypothetical protein
MVKSSHWIKVRVSLVLFLALALFPADPGLAAVYNIPPHAAVFVDSQNPNTNYEGQPDVYVEYFPDFGGSPLTQRGYFKFYLDSIPKNYIITAAKLYLFVVINDGHPPLDADLYHIISDTWSKFAITWNNQPPAGNYLATHDYMFWGSYYSWNLFESGLWDAAADLADGKVSLMLKLRQEGQLAEFAGYAFVAAGEGSPYLEVTAVPAAAASGAGVNLLLLN